MQRLEDGSTKASIKFAAPPRLAGGPGFASLDAIREDDPSDADRINQNNNAGTHAQGTLPPTGLAAVLSAGSATDDHVGTSKKKRFAMPSFLKNQKTQVKYRNR